MIDGQIRLGHSMPWGMVGGGRAARSAISTARPRCATAASSSLPAHSISTRSVAANSASGWV